MSVASHLRIFTKFLEKRRLTQEADLVLRQARKGKKTPGEIERKIAECQASPYWEIVNVAVKLCGCYRQRTQIPWLISRLTDKDQVGFIRRNAAVALGEIGDCSHEVISALIEGLKDPYWEVRSQCASTLGVTQNASDLAEAALCETLLGADYRQAISKFEPPVPVEKNFEVRMNIAESLGKIGGSKSAVVLQLLLSDSNWRVRQSVLQGYISLFKRGIVSAHEIKEKLTDFDLAADGFRPTFEIPTTFNELVALVNGRKSDTVPLSVTGESVQGKAEGRWGD